jgi:hypothetical protein
MRGEGAGFAAGVADSAAPGTAGVPGAAPAGAAELGAVRVEGATGVSDCDVP